MTPRDTQQPNVMIRTTDMCRSTLQKYARDKRVLQSFRAFIEWKRGNPIQAFGSRDYKFKAGELKGIPHATLNNDVCVVYEVSGSNPHVIVIHGLFSHDDLGTGNPARPRLQTKAASAFRNPRGVQRIEPTEVESCVGSSLRDVLSGPTLHWA